jgi:hypothetical protein
VSGAPDDKPTVPQKKPLLLDEMFSPQIAAELALRGVDCRAVVADPVLRAQSDLEIFDFAVRDGRVIVTNNVTDVESLRRARDGRLRRRAVVAPARLTPPLSTNCLSV